MKRTLVALLILTITIMLLAACGKTEAYEDTGTSTADPVAETMPEETTTEEKTEDTSEDGFERTYSLSNLEFYDTKNETWVTADFIPGAEEYVFHEDYSLEYNCKNYPTYDDMLNDSNYKMAYKSGSYNRTSGEEEVIITIEGHSQLGILDGDNLIIMHEYNGSPAVVGTYTLSE